MFSIFRRKKEERVQSCDYLVVGLGNPGKKYELSRHNCGFLAADLLAQELGVKRMQNVRHRALYCSAEYLGKRLFIIKPQTYMNLSGESVRDFAAAFSVPIERIIVLFDDVSLPEGQLRVRRAGSAGGHNGVKNIITHLNSDAFPRVKIGVGAPSGEGMADYVLSDLNADAFEGIRQAPKAVLCMIERGVDAAMQTYNGKKKDLDEGGA